MPVTPWRTAHPRQPNSPAQAPTIHAAWPIFSSATLIFSRSSRTRWRPACVAHVAPFEGAKLSYNLALFHSNLDNDIAFINSVTQGRAFFANIGQTRRQGVDVGAQLKTDRWLAYVAYYICQRHVPERLRRSIWQQSGSGCQGQHHHSTRQPVARHPREPGQIWCLLQGDGQMDCRCLGHLRKQRFPVR